MRQDLHQIGDVRLVEGGRQMHQPAQMLRRLAAEPREEIG